jgi:hypothetical protein
MFTRSLPETAYEPVPGRALGEASLRVYENKKKADQLVARFWLDWEKCCGGTYSE